eukprot:415444-Hanusia_phi.AAC.2
MTRKLKLETRTPGITEKSERDTLNLQVGRRSRVPGRHDGTSSSGSPGPYGTTVLWYFGTVQPSTSDF